MSWRASSWLPLGTRTSAPRMAPRGNATLAFAAAAIIDTAVLARRPRYSTAMLAESNTLLMIPVGEHAMQPKAVVARLIATHHGGRETQRPRGARIRIRPAPTGRGGLRRSPCRPLAEQPVRPSCFHRKDGACRRSLGGCSPERRRDEREYRYFYNAATVATSMRKASCTSLSTIRSVFGGYWPFGNRRGNSRRRNAMNCAMSCECTR